MGCQDGGAKAGPPAGSSEQLPIFILCTESAPYSRERVIRQTNYGVVLKKQGAHWIRTCMGAAEVHKYRQTDRRTVPL